MQLFPQFYCVFKVGGCSSHMRCRIEVKEGTMKVRKLFKFINAIVDFPEFLPLVEEYWKTTEPIFNSISALFRLSKKLKALKPLLKKLSKEHIGEIEKKTKLA